ncbi:solute carrier family 22 member [Holotrichia oblita]|uniref:Solute carrier family 22 member n=1 Tax=Holotrichia oblita TaxID=644536 RepID=A0ACB9SRG5_HOLOL|nr:solute carrier family 22 member [Holotrichia oblita]
MYYTRSATDKPEPDIIQNAIGVFGRWHWWVVLWIMSCKFAIAWHQIAIVFQAPTTNFVCIDPNITDPCSKDCPEHVFDREIFTETITSQWDLVCNRHQLNNIVQLATMFGILIGALVFGVISDRYGRRGPLVGAIVLQTVAGCGAAIVPWFWLHVILRFLCTTGTGGTMMTSFVLIMELVGLKWRTTVGILYQIPFNLGHLTLPLIAYYLRDWRFNQFFISITSVILFAYYWILPESPRWLLTVGKHEKAIKVLERAAHHNRLPTAHINTDVEHYVQKKDLKVVAGGNIFSLVATPSLRVKTICICFNWLVCGLCFFGVAQFMGELGGNIFLNVAVSAAVEIPGTIISIFAMEKLGRRMTLIGANLIAGLSCLAIAVVPADPAWIKTILGTAGIFGLSISFPTVYIYAGELFPTIVRNVGCGTASVFARVGSMVAPFMAKPIYGAQWITPTLFGVIPIVGAILCIFLPETLGCKLPDSIEEAEEFGKKRKNNL